MVISCILAICDGWTFLGCLCLHFIVREDERGTVGHLEIGPRDEPDLWRSTVLILIFIFHFSTMLHCEGHVGKNPSSSAKSKDETLRVPPLHNYTLRFCT
ncbi:hypothetical protein CHARACLAT_015797 [Characodon lateralis]|uniref:Secreted protein n=1 Tax=Characodon lateralis TaxID=208331 RepID=A0ABU7F421_9TELE|nr:hypothetical protein [Characodon lateralis]